MITSAQCRAARGLLGWTQQDLADRAHVGVVTIRQFELGATVPRYATLDVVKRALEQGGALFIDENGEGPGVRLRKTPLHPGAMVPQISSPKTVFSFHEELPAAFEQEIARPSDKRKRRKVKRRR
jgi:transcriptional regulator with XRE-family HTH domain